jgi:hypothetical protein
MVAEERSAGGLRRDRPADVPLSMTAEHSLTSGSTAAPSVAAILQERRSLIAVIGECRTFRWGARSATIGRIGFKAASA